MNIIVSYFYLFITIEMKGTEYQIFNWKEYVSLKRFWNIEWKYKTEKAKNEELEEERLVKDLAEKDEEIINSAKDYVELFRKYAITSILLLVSLIMNFILIIN